MAESGPSMRFQVAVNGEVVGTAGLDDRGVLNATITWVRRSLEDVADEVRNDPGFVEEEWESEQCDLHLGGLDSIAEEHLRWVNGELEPGDEVTIRILPPGEFDPPQERYGRDAFT